MLAKSPESKRSLQRQLILLIDPRSLTRTCVAGFLRSAGRAYDVVEVGQISDLAMPDRQINPVDLAILNIGGASVHDDRTHEKIEQLRDHLNGTPLVVLADSEEADEIRGALRLGIRGYIPTSLKSTVTLAALRLVLAGGTFVPAELPAADQLFAPDAPPVRDMLPARIDLTTREAPAGGDEDNLPPVPTLTNREMDVLRLLRRGKVNKVIAYELSMSESTVKVHIQHIMRKLKATNRTHVVYLANRYFADEALVG